MRASLAGIKQSKTTGWPCLRTPTALRRLATTILRLVFILAPCAFGAAVVRAADTPTRREWTVEGVVPEGLVYVPAQARTNATPVVFASCG